MTKKLPLVVIATSLLALGGCTKTADDRSGAPIIQPGQMPATQDANQPADQNQPIDQGRPIDQNRPTDPNQPSDMNQPGGMNQPGSINQPGASPSPTQ